MPLFTELKRNLNFDISEISSIKKARVDAIRSINSLSSHFPSNIDKIFTEIKKEIENNSDKELKKFQTEYIDYFTSRLRMSCSTAVNAYRQIGNALYMQIDTASDFLLGKTTENETFPSELDLTNVLMKKFGIKARFNNSVLLLSHTTVYRPNLYIIFPKDGFRFSWSERNSLNVDVPLEHFYDPNKKTLALQQLSTITDDYPKAEINSALNYLYHFKNLLLDLEEKANEGKLDRSVLDMFSAKELITQESFIDTLGLKTTDFDTALLTRYGVLVSGTFFAVSYKYRDYIFDKLEIGT